VAEATLLVFLAAAARAGVIAAHLGRGPLIRDYRRMMVMAMIAMRTMHVAVMVVIVVVIAVRPMNMRGISRRLTRRFDIAHWFLLLRP